MQVAVIGHVEWTRIALVKQVPVAGDVVHADLAWEGPAGGGAVAAVQMAKLAGNCTFFTALGDDTVGRRAKKELENQGVEVVGATRKQPTREAVSLIDATGERTTTTLGERLQPSHTDSLPWDRLKNFQAIYFAAGDAALLREARAAWRLIVTCRELSTAAAAGAPLDAVVGSGRDPAENYYPSFLATTPALVVSTDGAFGGRFSIQGGEFSHYKPVLPPGPVVDSYGVGDSFAAALTFGLGDYGDINLAIALAARCGAHCVSGRGPFLGQLSLVARRVASAIG